MKKLWTKRWVIVISAIYAVAFAYSFHSIITGAIPFWHDPARDLLAAWNNQTDPTLIGPPTGIEGLFYGPYWIWWLSFWQIFTKNPRWVTFFAQTLPFFILTPLLLSRFRHTIRPKIGLLLGSLFLFNFVNYTNFLWNPHLSLLFLMLMIFIVSKSKMTRADHIIVGLLVGLVGNFHMSIGLITAVSTTMFIIIRHTWDYFRVKLSPIKSFLNLGVYACSLLVTIIPFVAFEFRHNFMQLKTVFENVNKTLITPDTDVVKGGITGWQLITRYLQQGERLLDVNQLTFLVILVLTLLILAFKLFKNKLLRPQQLLTLYLGLFTLVTLVIYASTKNPVWDYHFVGIGVIWLFFFGLIASISRTFRWILSLGVVTTTIFAVVRLPNKLQEDALSIPSVSSKQAIVDLILDDVDQPFQWEAYSNDWRTSDFKYLFRWRALNNQQYDATRTKDVDIKYLIIPVTSQSLRNDFINYKSSNQTFHSEEIWVMGDHTEVIKRVKK